MTVKSFKDPIIWQKSHQLTIEVYQITSRFPSEEKFGIVNQIRRAAYSITSNIVEGYSPKSRKEFLQFLSIAKGSLEELKYFPLLSFDLGYIYKETNKIMESITEEISKLLFSFTKSLNTNKLTSDR